MFSVGTPSELSIELLNANSILQEPNNLFILETHISSSTVFAQQSPKPSGQEFALTHKTVIHLPEYITTAEDTCLSTNYNQCLVAKVKHTTPMSTRVQALCRGSLASRRRVFVKASRRRIVELH